MFPDGYVALRDRAKDIIISGGENISSVEIEDALTSHPPCSSGGRRGTRREMGRGSHRVRHAEGRRGLTDAELIDHVRGRLARFKAPKRVVFGALPKTSTGKVQKKVLRDQLRST